MANERYELEKVSAPNARLDTRQRGRIVRPSSESLFDSYEDPRVEETAENSLNLRDIWLMVRRRKWLVLTIITMVTTVVAIQMNRTPLYYQANSIIEIGKENNAIGDKIIVNDSETDPYFMVTIKTKMLMLTSRPLLEDAVVNLKLDQNLKFLDLTKKSWWNSYGQKKNSTEILPNTIPPELENEITRSPAESARLDPYVNLVSDNLNVQQVRDTRAITLSFTHTDPQIAAQIANELTRLFKVRNFDTKIGNLGQTEEWLRLSIRKVKAELQQAQESLAQYARDHDIVTMGANDTLNITALAQYQSELGRAEANRIKLEALYEEVRKGNVSKLPAEFEDKSTAKVIALQKQLSEAQAKEVMLSEKFGPEKPEIKETKSLIVELEKQIAVGTRALEDKFKADYERAVREEQSIKSKRNQAKSEAADGNYDGIRLGVLQQDVETKEKLYKDLSDKLQQAEIKVKEQSNNIHVLVPAQIPNTPAGPRRLLTTLIAFFLSMLVAVGLALFLEYLDNTINTVEDVERYAQLPALGVIPAIATSTSLRRLPTPPTDSSDEKDATALALAGASLSTQLMTLDNQSTVAEAYRALRTSVLLSSAGRPPKSILVTSGRPGEGKTTTAVNTAISLAQLGASVLIIDCDLRRPKVHKVFGINQANGLSTYLSRETELDGLIHALPITNLSLLPCGPTPPNPAELISSEKMRDMLTLLGERFDHIIIDSPPLINVTDPVILSTMVDGVIMVVQAGKSTRDVVRRASQELTGVGAKVFGVVLNNVNLQREGYDEYYYQRYYTGYYGTVDNGNGDH